MDSQQAITQLLSYRMLAGFDQRDFGPLLAASSIRSLAAGDVLFTAGEDLDEGYILLDGRLEEVSEPRPSRFLRSQHYVPGRYVAPQGLVSAEAARTECKALDTSVVLAIPRSAMATLLATGDPIVLRLIDTLLEYMVAEVRDSNRRLDEIHSRPHETLQQLRRLAEPSGT